MGDIIKVNLGEDHIYESSTDIIGRAGEGNITQFEITIPEQLRSWNIYLDFELPSGETLRTPRLEAGNGVATYDVIPYLLAAKGEINVQVVIEKEGKTWKSSTKRYNNLYGINALDEIPKKEDFLTQAQALIDELSGEVQDIANALADNAEFAEAVFNKCAEYGLGVSTPTVILTDCNEGIYSGWYKTANSAANAPLVAGGWMRADMFDQSNGTQTWHYEQFGGVMAQRYLINGVWQPWEYVIPPMLVGVEYCTIERWHGKPIYHKLVEFGYLPVSGTKTVNVTIEDIRDIVSVDGLCTRIYESSMERNFVPLAMTNLIESSWITKLDTKICSFGIQTNQDASAYYTIFRLRYTKL